MKSVRHRIAPSSLALVVALAMSLSPLRARAQFLVFDPSNYAQNVMTAANTLQQINNQITGLQNQARMLLNQARNLANLPYSSLQTIQQSIGETQRLLGQAQRIAYDVQQIDQAFTTQYGVANVSSTSAALIDGARQRWQNSLAAFQDSLRVQAGIVQGIETARSEAGALVSSSQSAVGALQASQAGNQLLALQSKQLADVTALLASQGRAQSLEMARNAEAQEQAREQMRRFIAPGQGYQPGNVAMFHN
ncbi:MAG: P-type conjugative transfer protein TrbJ [Methylocystis sp.]|uniref:P-type conjugative transfer protein TrbJ n=1 Tax=Methylocystis sp. TaxID=1911079 RepID=UPI00394AC411